MDRPLAPEVQRHDRRRRSLQIALPALIVVLLIVWLPGWMRPSIPRARLRTARVTTGPIEAAIMALSPPKSSAMIDAGGRCRLRCLLSLSTGGETLMASRKMLTDCWPGGVASTSGSVSRSPDVEAGGARRRGLEGVR